MGAPCGSSLRDSVDAALRTGFNGDFRIRESLPFTTYSSRPNFPELKSSMACMISRWVFMTNGP